MRSKTSVVRRAAVPRETIVTMRIRIFWIDHGTLEVVEMVGEATVAGRPAVLPRITGQAWVYSKEELRVDAADPFTRGFALSDSWGPQVDQLG